MSIEEAIKQKTFKTEQEKALINILYTGNFLTLRQGQVFKAYGLTHQQYNVLRILRGRKGEPASVKLLIERMLDKSSNVSRLVDKLVQKKLATREFCESDRRQVDIFITKEGLDLLDLITKEQPSPAEMLRGLSEKQLEDLNTTLDLIRDVFNQ